MLNKKVFFIQIHYLYLDIMIINKVHNGYRRLDLPMDIVEKKIKQSGTPLVLR